jgi:histidine triad (HIT) family protein
VRVAGCVFCDIVAGEEAAEVVYEDERVTAFKPLQPEAPIHLILVSRVHIPSVDALLEEHRDLWMALLQASQVLARSSSVDVDHVGYELITHAGRHDTREVSHLHLHLLSGGRETA